MTAMRLRTGRPLPRRRWTHRLPLMRLRVRTALAGARVQTWPFVPLALAWRRASARRGPVDQRERVRWHRLVDARVTRLSQHTHVHAHAAASHPSSATWPRIAWRVKQEPAAAARRSPATAPPAGRDAPIAPSPRIVSTPGQSRFDRVVMRMHVEATMRGRTPATIVTPSTRIVSSRAAPPAVVIDRPIARRLAPFADTAPRMQRRAAPTSLSPSPSLALAQAPRVALRALATAHTSRLSASHGPSSFVHSGRRGRSAGDSHEIASDAARVFGRPVVPLVWRTPGTRATAASAPEAVGAQTADARAGSRAAVSAAARSEARLSEVRTAASAREAQAVQLAPAVIDRLATDVIHRIERRLRIERERRGL